MHKTEMRQLTPQKSAPNDMHKTEMHQKSLPKNASKIMQKCVINHPPNKCVKNHPPKKCVKVHLRQNSLRQRSLKIYLRQNSLRQRSPIVSLRRSSPCVKIPKVKIPASQFRASNIPCVTRPPPPAWLSAYCPNRYTVPGFHILEYRINPSQGDPPEYKGGDCSPFEFHTTC